MTPEATFKTNRGKFKKGYYFFEIWSGPPYWKFYARKSAANAQRVNNSPCVLEYFEKLPDGAKIQKHP